jgi:membrane-associated protein
MDSLFLHLKDLFTNLDGTLTYWAKNYEGWIYGILFLIIFCETGLVIAPFLPGDSLLFGAGVVATKGDMQLWVLLLILPVAAILGDNLNYFTGRLIGPKIFRKEGSRWFSVKTLQKTQAFYDKHGPKTVVLARFIPLVRTFAPFVAGVGKMYYPRFMIFGVIGAFLWVVVCCGAGYLLADIKMVKEHFELVVIAIICISLLPPLIGWLNGVLKEKKSAKQESEEV